jgi:hypothetical protein
LFCLILTNIPILPSSDVTVAVCGILSDAAAGHVPKTVVRHNHIFGFIHFPTVYAQESCEINPKKDYTRSNMNIGFCSTASDALWDEAAALGFGVHPRAIQANLTYNK